LIALCAEQILQNLAPCDSARCLTSPLVKCRFLRGDHRAKRATAPLGPEQVAQIGGLYRRIVTVCRERVQRITAGQARDKGGACGGDAKQPHIAGESRRFEQTGLAGIGALHRAGLSIII
jgi:hypothetical protein